MRDRTVREVKEIAKGVLFRQFLELASYDRRFDATDRYIEQVIDRRIDRRLDDLRAKTASDVARIERDRRMTDIRAALELVGTGDARFRLEEELTRLVLNGD